MTVCYAPVCTCWQAFEPRFVGRLGSVCIDKQSLGIELCGAILLIDLSSVIRLYGESMASIRLFGAGRIHQLEIVPSDAV